MAKRDLLIGWLKDAHSMEQSQKRMLERFAGDFDSLSDARARLEEHIKVTERQATDIAECLKRLDEGTSAAKSTMGSIMGSLQGMATAPFKGDVIKNLIVMHAGEHFEHASYLPLTTAAIECGEEEIAAVCEHIMHEELEMAQWTEGQLPNMTIAVMREEG